VTMHLPSTIIEIWPFEVLPERLFQEQRSVVGRSVLNITLISYTPVRCVGTSPVVENIYLLYSRNTSFLLNIP